MALTLKITSYQSQVLGTESIRTFDESGGRVGRAQGNDWVLPDPERYISGSHFTITCANHTYYLTDTSTNGVFVNQSTTPIGKGNTVPLHDGDQLKFGDYEIAVSFEGTTSETDPFDGWPEHKGIVGRESASSAAPVADGMDITGTFDPLEDEEPTDRRFSPFPESRDHGSDVFGDYGAEPDHVSSLEEAFQPPAAHVEQIPDDWDMTDYSSQPGSEAGHQAAPSGFSEVSQPARSNAFPVQDTGHLQAMPPDTPQPPAPQQQASQRPKAEPPQAMHQTAPHPPPPAEQQAAASSALYNAFMEGAGIDPQSVQQEDIDKAMRDYGMLFRTVIQGMMEVLMARASLKSEFRLPLTTIRPVENNPLKFSPTVDDALYNLFITKGRGYLGPVEAIQEGFADIRNHQVAMVAGMQAAFTELIEIFQPDKFDRDEKGGVRASLMSINRKSRAWDAFCEFYEKTARDSDSAFQNLFGENFAIAYEEQVRRLSLLK